MSECIGHHDEVAALFYKGTSLFIPPFEVAREPRGDETYEKTYYRLCAEQGIVGYNEGLRIYHSVKGAPAIRGFIMQPRYGELDYSEFLIPLPEVPEYLEQENGFQLRSDLDKDLVLAAHALLVHRG